MHLASQLRRDDVQCGVLQVIMADDVEAEPSSSENAQLAASAAAAAAAEIPQVCILSHICPLNTPHASLSASVSADDCTC